MKKLILMTSALTLMGGAAIADITVGGEAKVKYGNWGTAPGTAAAFSFNTKATLTMEQSSGDLSYGAKLTLENGKNAAQGVIWVSGGFGKVSFGIDEFDEIKGKSDAANPNFGWDVNGAAKEKDFGDVKYEGTFGNTTATLVAAVKGMGKGDAAWDLGLKYAGGTWNASLDTDSSNAWKIKGDVAVGNFTIGASYDNASAYDVWAKTTFGAINAKLTYASSGKITAAFDGDTGNVKWALEANNKSHVKASVDYTMDALSIGLAYDNKDSGDAAGACTYAGNDATAACGTGIKDRGDDADIILKVGYKATDNLKFEVKANDASEYEISMTAGFTF